MKVGRFNEVGSKMNARTFEANLLARCVQAATASCPVTAEDAVEANVFRLAGMVWWFGVSFRMGTTGYGRAVRGTSNGMPKSN